MKNIGNGDVYTVIVKSLYDFEDDMRKAFAKYTEFEFCGYEWDNGGNILLTVIESNGFKRYKSRFDSIESLDIISEFYGQTVEFTDCNNNCNYAGYGSTIYLFCR